METKDPRTRDAPDTGPDTGFGRLVAVDFESFYDTKQGYSLSKMTAYDYIHDHRFDPYLVAVVGETGKEYVGNPLDFDWMQLDGCELVMHNAAFDGLIVLHLIETGQIPDFKRTLSDTADMCAFMGLPRALDKACGYLLGISVSKARRAAMDGVRFQDLGEEARAGMIDYAADDSRLCLRLYQKYADKWPWWEQEISRLNRECTVWGGIHIDRAAAVAGLERLRKRKADAEATIPWNDGERKTGSCKHFIAYLRDAGLPVPSSLNKQDPGFAAWLKTYGSDPVVAARLDVASLGSHIKRLEAVLLRGDDDDILRVDSMFYGAHCLTGGHEVLTRDGWVRLDQWRGGEIMQWHNATKALDFLPATANAFRNTERAMVEVDAPFYKAVMTLGHTVPRYTATQTFRPMKAEQLLASRQQITVPVSGMYGGTGVITPEQMRVLVATQADGSFAKDYGDLIFTLRKQRKIDRVQDLLVAAGLPYKLQYFPSTPTQARITVRRRFLPPWLCRERKVFGPWLLDSTREAREAFLDEFFRWDGWSTERTTPNGSTFSIKEYYSSVPENVRWVTTMLHITGHSAGTFGVRSARGTHRPGYRVNQRENDYTCICAALGQVREVAAVPEVYCPTTETGWFLCRHKDTIFVTGNTGRCSGGADRDNDDSGGGAKFNIYNLPKGDDEGLIHGVDMRGILTPRPGHAFVIFDFGQIEARVVQWLAGNKAFLERAARENIYQAVAKTLGWYPEDGSDLKGHDRKLYALAKEAGLGLGFGMGAAKFLLRCEKSGIALDPVPKDRWVLDRRSKFILRNVAQKPWTDPANEEWISRFFAADNIVQAWRARNPQVVALWRALEDSLAAAADRQEAVHYYTLPSGRRKPYWKPRRTAVPKIVLDPDSGEASQVVESRLTAFLVRDSKQMYKTLHGGPITENVVQATARDVMFFGAIAVGRESPKRADGTAAWKYLWNCYDELIFEVPLSDADDACKVIPRCLTDTDTDISGWAKGLPLEVEGGVAERYKKSDPRWFKYPVRA